MLSHGASIIDLTDSHPSFSSLAFFTFATFSMSYDMSLAYSSLARSTGCMLCRITLGIISGLVSFDIIDHIDGIATGMWSLELRTLDCAMVRSVWYRPIFNIISGNLMPFLVMHVASFDTFTFHLFLRPIALV